MQEKIESYLRDEKGVVSEVVREKLRQKVMKYEDIAREFSMWLDERKYNDNGVKVAGYKAGDIYGMAPMLDGIGVFNFMVDLRDDPGEAQKVIDKGFVIL